MNVYSFVVFYLFVVFYFLMLGRLVTGPTYARERVNIPTK